MGRKHKHSKDKLYKTVSELKSHHAGPNRDLELSASTRRLKFNSCCISLCQISEKPMGLCDDTNYCYVFECNLIVKFLEKFQLHPITGQKVTNKNNLIDLKFHKNTDHQYHCPIIYKLFNQNTKIVANKKTGNVYSYEAYQQLNLKPGNFRDLLTDEPFDKSDIVTIQDPEISATKWAVSEFYYVKNNLKIDDDCSDSKIRNIDQSNILKASLEEFNSRAESIAEEYRKLVGNNVTSCDSKPVALDALNSATYSDGTLSRSVTSTVMNVTVSQVPALLKHEEILYPRIKKKGYIQMVTNFGPMNLELFCDRAPKTCHNFLLLSSRGYYNDTIFHRLIKNFIIQGGDPTGTGKGGQSAWQEPFKDECHGDLKHVGRGVLSMANSGPNTNKSQFYITLRGNWDHLDGKHTVFGRLVGGDETLAKIEDVEVDKNDRPKREVKIIKMVKYVDPFEEEEKAIDKKRSELSNSSAGKRPSESKSGAGLKKFRCGVGAYIDLSLVQRQSDTTDVTEQAESLSHQVEDESTSLARKLADLKEKRRERVNGKSYGNFSNW